jgi:hypothetical protein
MSIKTNVAKFITGTTARAESIVALKASFKGKSEAVVRTALLPIVAADKRYNVPVVASERPKFAGEMVMDSSAAKYETARSMLADMVANVLSKKAKPSAKYEYVFSRKQKAGAKVYLALFASAAEAKAALTTE